ncbi:MAG: leucine-rich repeat domain-containing protein, partial [Paludibacter sp.]
VSKNSSQIYLANEIACLGCPSLKLINLPLNITGFGYQAFSGCTKLTNLDIPNTVTSIGNFAFSNCTGFTGNLVIPNTVTTIEIGAFSGCSGFSGTLTLPNAITTIPSGAFSSCTGLGGVLTIPLSVLTINSDAFFGCSKFTKLEINKNTNRIVDYAFTNCSGLQKITVASSTPPTIYTNTFVGVNKQTCILEVPIGSLSAYKSANFWKTFYTISEKDFNTISGNLDLNSNLLKVYSKESDIVIEGTSKGEIITIYSMNGIQLQNIKSHGEQIVISMERNAVYFIKIQSRVFKLIL